METKKESLLTTLIAFPIVWLFISPIVLLAGVYETWAVNTVLNWYFPSFNVSFYQLFGAVIIFSFINARFVFRIKQDYLDNGKWEPIAFAIYSPLLMILVAWLGKLIFGG